MREIVIELKDGTIHRYQHESRPGGSYRLSIRYESEWVVVKDEWDKEEAFPTADVKKVTAIPFGRY